MTYYAILIGEDIVCIGDTELILEFTGWSKKTLHQYCSNTRNNTSLKSSFGIDIGYVDYHNKQVEERVIKPWLSIIPLVEKITEEEYFELLDNDYFKPKMKER